MTTHAPDNSRRRFIKLTAIGLAAAPFASTLLNGIAGATEMVSETDPQAAALSYKADATKAEKRTDATAHCANCGLYTGKEGDARGPCAIFQGKSVSASGWCTAWVKKAS